MQQESTAPTSRSTLQPQIALQISFEELQAIPTLHCRGFMRPKIARVLKDLLISIQNEEVFSPAASYSIVGVEETSSESLVLGDGTELCGPLVAHKFRSASMVMATATTLGDRVGGLVERSFVSGEQLRAVLLEEIANFALFKLNEQLLEVAREEAVERGLSASGPLCPGNEGFDLQEQSKVLQLADAARVGIALSEKSMMSPRHSHTQLVGFGRRMSDWSYADNCDSCKARERCPYLKAN